MALLRFNGFIKNIKYEPQFTEDLHVYNYNSFNANTCSTYGLIKLGPNDNIVYAKWVTPKRTRSYPFARLYNIYGFNSNKITIIPIIKDEGAGSGNNDRINAITFYWMNLLNIYIILAWYENAEKKPDSDNLITNQKFNNEFIKQKILEITKSKMTALHWNTEHFEKDFEYVWKKSVQSYERISKENKVKLHSAENHRKRLEKFKKNRKFNLDVFKDYTLQRSKEARMREIKTIHELESLSEGNKAIINVYNYLGGIYYLTADEVFLENDVFVIQESKNSSTSKLTSKDDIKDGLFKLILYSNMEKLEFNNKKVEFKTRLKLTGNIQGNLLLPNSKEDIRFFIDQNQFKKNQKEIIYRLNDESKINNLEIHIGTNQPKKNKKRYLKIDEYL